MQTEQQRVVDVQVHRLGAKLLFDEHDLSPYWGMVSVFDPDLEGKQFVVGGEEYGIETASYWQGKLDDPSGDVDGGLYEYKLGVWMTDEHRDKGVDLTFRPGFPNPEHVDTGDGIESIPSDCPNSVRVQVEATNLSKVELHSVMQALAAAIDLNPDYFAPDAVHEWSSIYGIETYLRIENATAERQLVADDGIIGDIAQFSSGEGSKGEWKWDHEEATGHYEAVALDPGSWDRLLEGRTMPKRVKCYLPQHLRKNDEEVPLAHHKLESQYWAGYDGESLSYSNYERVIENFARSVYPTPVKIRVQDAGRESCTSARRGVNGLAELVSEHRERRLWSVSATGFSLREPPSVFYIVGRHVVDMNWRSQLPNRDVLWGLLLIVVVVLLLWFFGIVEFDIGSARWEDITE